MSSILLTIALVLFAVALFSLRVVLPVLGVLSAATLVYAGFDLFGTWDETARKITNAAGQSGGPREIIPGQHAGAAGMVHAAPLFLIGIGIAGVAGFARRLVTLVRGY